MQPPNLASLEKDYQILTELHYGAHAVTYLARHLKLNRDVTITVVQSDNRASLEGFASDAVRLVANRHPNVVPVIEGRWLDDDAYAVVRARVRGSTLEQFAAAGGALTPTRLDTALRELASALGWAARHGITHRAICAESLVFQQGSGRVLIAFDHAAVPASDDDTLRSLAALMSGGAVVNVLPYTALLAPGAGAPTPVTLAALSDTPVAVPVARDDDAVVVVKRGMGFTARVLSAFVIAAALIIFAVIYVKNRAAGAPAPQLTASGAIPDTQGEAAGEIALHSGRHDTIATSSGYPTPTIIQDPSMPPPPPPQPEPPVVESPPAPPVMATPPVAAPRIQPAPRPADICDSPALADQHQCLMNAVQRNDRELNDVYQKLIAALRAQANVSDGDPDPSTVDDLRADQRRWLEQRDDACHAVGDGPLYARDRAACFADQTNDRLSKLRDQLQNP